VSGNRRTLEIHKQETTLEILPQQSLVVEKTLTTLEFDGGDTLEVTADMPLALVIDPAKSVVIEKKQLSILEVGLKGDKGDPGTPGVSEDAVPYAKLTDYVKSGSTDIYYIGEADPGVLVSQALWRIKKTTILNNGDISTRWADGVATFTKVWDDRLTYTYLP